MVEQIKNNAAVSSIQPQVDPKITPNMVPTCPQRGAKGCPEDPPIGFRRAQVGPSLPQDGFNVPQVLQDGLGMSEVGLMVAPGRPQEGPRWPHRGPRGSQDGPKRTQTGPETAPRGAKMVPKGPKVAPRWP